MFTPIRSIGTYAYDIHFDITRESTSEALLVGFSVPDRDLNRREIRVCIRTSYRRAVSAIRTIDSERTRFSRLQTCKRISLLYIERDHIKSMSSSHRASFRRGVDALCSLTLFEFSRRGVRSTWPRRNIGLPSKPTVLTRHTPGTFFRI